MRTALFHDSLPHPVTVLTYGALSHRTKPAYTGASMVVSAVCESLLRVGKRRSWPTATGHEAPLACSRIEPLERPVWDQSRLRRKNMQAEVFFPLGLTRGISSVAVGGRLLRKNVFVTIGRNPLLMIGYHRNKAKIIRGQDVRCKQWSAIAFFYPNRKWIVCDFDERPL